MDKNQKAAMRAQEDAALNRALIWVGGAVVLEALLLFVNRYFINFRVSEADTAILMWNVLKVVRIAGAVAGVALLVWAVLRFRKGQRAEVVTGAGLACCAAALCAHVAVAFEKSGVQMLFLLVPAWAGLALVYYLYQREFFLGAAASGLSVLGLWFVRAGGGVGIEAILALCAVAVVLAATLYLKKTGGLVPRGNGEMLRFLSKKTVYLIPMVSCAVGMAAVVLAMVMGAGVAYYLLFAMVVWLFALLVYYTVKLM